MEQRRPRPFLLQASRLLASGPPVTSFILCTPFPLSRAALSVSFCWCETGSRAGLPQTHCVAEAGFELLDPVWRLQAGATGPASFSISDAFFVHRHPYNAWHCFVGLSLLCCVIALLLMLRVTVSSHSRFLISF